MKLPIYKSKSLRCGLGVLAGVAMLLCAIPVRANGSGSKLIHLESTSQSTTSSPTFFPTGCDPTVAGSCKYATQTITGSGQVSPFGPVTITGTGSILLSFTPSGAHNAAGDSTGLCAPETSTATVTFADGSSINQSSQGTVCCAAADCSPFFFQLPFVTHLATVYTGGTGRFAGVTGGGMDSGNTTSGDIVLGVGEGVMMLAGH